MLPNLTAIPQNTQKVLSDNLFLIPPYQRPYSWGDKDECEILWNDLYERFSSTPDVLYFLGSIVLAEDEDKVSVEDGEDEKQEDKKFGGKRFMVVIDGQQRLITLAILVRVFYNCNVGLSALKDCLYRYDRWDESKLGNKMKSDVLGGTESIMLSDVLDEEAGKVAMSAGDNNYARTYRLFSVKTSEVKCKENLRKFIDYVLDKVYLLPIVCPSRDDALTIFETINNRGLDLSPADIFKAILYKKAGNDADDFIGSWDKLVSGLSEESKSKELTVTDLFRMYMFLLRAEHEDTGKVFGVREFFDKGITSNGQKNGKPEYMLKNQNWRNVISSLERLKEAEQLLTGDKYPHIKQWYDTLACYDRKEVTIPAIICVYICLEQLNLNGDEVWIISSGNEKFCEMFVKGLVRYVYAKGFGGITVGGKSVTDAMLMAAVAAVKKEKFSLEFNFGEDFWQRLDGTLSPKFRRGFCMILELINSQYTMTHLKGDVEHILPKKWDNDWYDKWNKEEVSKVMDTLGNLVLLEKSINIKGGNSFFNEKKKQYKNSAFAEAKALCTIDTWIYEEYKKRHDLAKERLCKFMQGEL